MSHPTQQQTPKDVSDMPEQKTLLLTANQVSILRVLISWNHYWRSYSYLSSETDIPVDVLKTEMKTMATNGWVEYLKGLLDDDGQVGGSGWFIVYPFQRKLEEALQEFEIKAPESWKEINAWKLIRDNTFGSERHLVTGSVNILIEIAVSQAVQKAKQEQLSEIVKKWREEMRTHLNRYDDQYHGQWGNGMLCALDIMENISPETQPKE